jgi:hypothetical protein
MQFEIQLPSPCGELFAIFSLLFQQFKELARLSYLDLRYFGRIIERNRAETFKLNEEERYKVKREGPKHGRVGE